ncbi:MAG TPA: hypothetical protein PLI59_03820, partial [Candidatus Obscuribacter sp.]|nr:hypothetical protein [Candidatus Obscuribacter sp.]
MKNRNNLKALTCAVLAVAALASTVNVQALADEPKDMASNAVLFPVRAASIASGLVIGIPVAIARRSSNRVIEYTGNFADKMGGKDHIPPKVFGSIFGLPFGLLVGTGEGLYYGGKNAFSNSVEKPFSLAAF